MTKTLLGVEAKPCPKHGDADIGVLTGLCLVCEREVDNKLFRLLLDSLTKR